MTHLAPQHLKPNAGTTTTPAATKTPEATCAWGQYRGDRVAPSAYKGRVYVWNHRGAFKDKPQATVGVGLPLSEARRLVKLLQARIDEAERQAREAA